MSKRIDWDKLRRLYIMDGLSYRQIAEQESVSPRAVAKHGRAENWPGARKLWRIEREAAVRQSVLQSDIGLTKRIELLVARYIDQFLYDEHPTVPPEDALPWVELALGLHPDAQPQAQPDGNPALWSVIFQKAQKELEHIE